MSTIYSRRLITSTTANWPLPCENNATACKKCKNILTKSFLHEPLYDAWYRWSLRMEWKAGWFLQFPWQDTLKRMIQQVPWFCAWEHFPWKWAFPPTHLPHRFRILFYISAQLFFFFFLISSGRKQLSVKDAGQGMARPLRTQPWCDKPGAEQVTNTD